LLSHPDAVKLPPQAPLKLQSLENLYSTPQLTLKCKQSVLAVRISFAVPLVIIELTVLSSRISHAMAACVYTFAASTGDFGRMPHAIQSLRGVGCLNLHNL
jgi:hypothetical protein